MNDKSKRRNWLFVLIISIISLSVSVLFVNYILQSKKDLYGQFCVYDGGIIVYKEGVIQEFDKYSLSNTPLEHSVFSPGLLTSLWVDANKNIYAVSNKYNLFVKLFKNNTWEKFNFDANENYVIGPSFSRKGSICIAVEQNTGKVFEFQSSGVNELFSIQDKIEKPLSISFCQVVGDQIYFHEYYNNCLWIIDLGVDKISSVEMNQFGLFPIAMAVAKGQIYFIDSSEKKIGIFSLERNLMQVIEKKFQRVSGIYSYNDSIYVLDSPARTIEKIAPGIAK